MANKGRLTTGIFCLFLAGLLAWHIALPDRARSETENRTLAPVLMLAGLVLCTAYLVDGSYNPFLYFRF